MAQAFAKSQIDMPGGPLWNKILRFAAPVTATSILEQLFNASDLAIVGNFAPEALRTVSIAAVGANSQVVALVVYLFVGIALGANVVIANAIGRNDKEVVRKAVQTSVATALLCGILVAIPGEIFAQPLMVLLKVSGDVLPSAVLYLKIYFVGLPVILLYNFEAAIFRSIGETRMPLLALAFGGVLYVLLNILFVVGFGLAVEGVAIVTVISNAVSSLILYRKLRRTSEEIRLETARLAIDRRSFRAILRIGLRVAETRCLASRISYCKQLLTVLALSSSWRRQALPATSK